MWLTVRFWPWASSEQQRRCLPSLLSPLHSSKQWSPINCASSFLLLRSFIFIRKIGTNRHWGVCILCLWLVSSKQPNSCSWSLFRAKLIKTLSSVAISQVLAVLGLVCAALPGHSTLLSLWADDWAPLMFRVSFNCQDTQSLVEGLSQATLPVSLAGLLFILIACWEVLLWLLLMNPFFLYDTSICCLPRPCEEQGCSSEPHTILTYQSYNVDHFVQ